MNFELTLKEAPSIWTVFLESGISTAVIGLLGIVFVAWLTHYLGKSEGKKQLELRLKQTSAILAHHLDKFALELSNTIGQNGDDDSDPTSEIPKFPSLPADINLSLIPPDILTRILALQMNQALGEGAISYWFRDQDPDSAFLTASERCGYLGYEACQLSTLLRKHSKLPHPVYGESYEEFMKSFKKLHDDKVKRDGGAK